MTDSKVTVLGGGIMGNGIAQIAATAGHPVTLVEVGEEQVRRALDSIDSSLARLVRSERITEDESSEARGRIATATEVSAGVEGSAIIVEAVPEVIELKHEVFKQAHSAAPEDAVFCTNTSQFSITQIASVLDDDAHRMIGTHFFNPPVIMKLVEIVRGMRTSDETYTKARAFSEGLGKEVVVCRKDSPGFITTRAYVALRTECLRILEEGIASVEDIDKALKFGFNLPMGPFEMGDFNGLDTFMNALPKLADAHGDHFDPTTSLKNLVASGAIGRKVGRGFYEYDEDGNRIGPSPGL